MFHRNQFIIPVETWMYQKQAWRILTVTLFVTNVLACVGLLFNNAISIEIKQCQYKMITEYGAVCQMRTDRGNQTTWKKTARLCPPQIAYDLVWPVIKLGPLWLQASH
jgi:hypothetical protein